MREPDEIIDGQTKLWHAPIERVHAWMDAHPDVTHPASRGGRWRDLWYILLYVSGGDYDDDIADLRGFAVSLRDIRTAPPEWPRLYREAEWELCVEQVRRLDSELVNGDGLYDPADQPPELLYQFHGLPEATVMNVGGTLGESFATFGWQLLCRGRRPDGEMHTALSVAVNQLREGLQKPPLRIATGDPNRALGESYTGLLCSVEDGSLTTPAIRF